MSHLSCKTSSSEKLEDEHSVGYSGPMFFSTVLNVLGQITLSFLILLSIPIFVFLSLLFYILRNVVKLFAKIFRKDFTKIVSSRSAVFCVDRITTSPNCNVVVCEILEGSFDVNALYSVLENICQSIIENMKTNKTAAYQELVQYIVPWGGYFFWKQDSQFDINNHIKIASVGKQYTEDDLMEICKSCISQKWPERRPLWECFIVPSYSPTNSSRSEAHHSAVVLTFHHSVGDAYSLLNFTLNEICEKKSHSIAIPNFFKSTWYSKVWHAITVPFRLSWEIADSLIMMSKHCQISHKGQENNCFHLDSTPLLPVSLIKTVKAKYKTSFAAVQTSVIAGALRDLCKQKRLTVSQLTPCLTIFPYPGRKDSVFQNHWSGAIINLPTSDQDPIARLCTSQTIIEKAKTSTWPKFMFFQLNAYGWLPAPLTRFLTNSIRPPTSFSSFPLGLDYFTVFGGRVVDCFGYYGVPEGSTGIAFSSASYVDNFRITIMAKPSVVTQEDVRLLSCLIEQHFRTLVDTIIKEA